MNSVATFELLNLRGIFPPDTIFHEHTAVRHSDIDLAAQCYERMGYSVNVRDDRRVAFVQKAGHRVEIIHPDVAEPHEAFAVRTVDEWEVARAAVRAVPNIFQVTIDDEEKVGFRNLLFRHVPTGSFLQIVWREEQVFAGVFPD